jgi:hypothetical protein
MTIRESASVGKCDVERGVESSLIERALILNVTIATMIGKTIFIFNSVERVCFRRGDIT